MLVDDHEVFLQTAVDYLERHPELIVVGTALSGEEALARAQDLQPDVILVDLDMPGLNGLETISRLRIILPRTTFIVLTLLDVSSYRSAALAAGAHDFISKSTLSRDLLPGIHRAAEARNGAGGSDQRTAVD
jgi:two-component system nitrate/nitrite response regulator NarL